LLLRQDEGDPLVISGVLNGSSAKGKHGLLVHEHQGPML
jgi:hypothetical protein